MSIKFDIPSLFAAVVRSTRLPEDEDMTSLPLDILDRRDWQGMQFMTLIFECRFIRSDMRRPRYFL